MRKFIRPYNEMIDYLQRKYFEEYLKPKAEERIAVIGKICAGCEEDLQFKKFSKRTESSDGHERLCKACAAIKERNYRLSKKPAKLNGYKTRFTEGANYDPSWESKITRNNS